MARYQGKIVSTVVLSVTCLAAFAQDGDPNWPLCPQPLDIPPRPVITEELGPDDIHLTADEADLVEGGMSTLTGQVEITKGEQQVRTDKMQYDQANDTADMQGNIHYWDDSVFLFSEEAHLELDEGTGEFKNSDYRIRDNRGRGHAGNLFMDVGKTTDLKDVDYSTCTPEDNFWKLSASEIHLDHEEEWGSARNVVMKIKNVPVFYTPYMSFPLSKKRKSGFLTPSIGTTNKSGLDVRTPYYWNIAPHMDATLTPRLLSDRGIMLMGEYRYLFSRGTGRLDLEYLPSDSEFDDDDRNLFGFTHEQTFGPTGELFLTYNRVSDKEYFEDFGTNITLTSTRYLERRGEVSYLGSWWRMSGLVQNYQTVDRSIPITSRPYKRLPQFKFGTVLPERNRQINYGFDTEVVYFDRGDNDLSLNEDNGLRLDVYPFVSYPIRGLAGYIKPKLGVKFTQYSLSDFGNQFELSPSRTLPIVSLDSGLFLERDTQLFGQDYLHTLEPQLYYLYIPEDDQDDIPVFDTGVYDFTFDSLFRENRFNNNDRVGDANQVTFALTTRLINQNNGQDMGHIRLGQIYYLRDRDVTLPNRRVEDEDLSPIVAEFGTTFFNHWALLSEFQYDPNNRRTQKLIGQLQYNPGDGRIVNLAYRTRRDRNQVRTSNFRNIEQTDISFRWPINPKWSVVGRWNYALPENRSLEIFGGIEFEDCCWGMRAVARRFLSDIEGDFETGVFLQIELKGLAGVGTKTVEFLRKNIPGYESEF